MLVGTCFSSAMIAASEPEHGFLSWSAHQLLERHSQAVYQHDSPSQEIVSGEIWWQNVKA